VARAACGVRERASRQPSRVIPNVDGPGLNQGVEALPVSREQGPLRLLETGRVTGQGSHDPVGRLPGSPHAILAFAGASRLVHEPAQRNGGPPRAGC
jgi:hypothetical protein